MVDFEKIKELAADQKISIKKLEKTIGLGNGSIGKWRNGKSPKVENLEKVADYFHVSIGDLLQNA